MATINSVLKDFQTLSQPDQKKVWLAVKALSENTDLLQKNRTQDDSREAIFFESLSQYLRMKQGEKVAPYSVFKSSGYYREFFQAFQHVEQYINNNCPQGVTISRMQRECFYDLYAHLVADNLKNIDIPVTLRSLVTTHSVFAAVVNRNFPGYIESGLFMTLIKRLSAR